MKPNKHRRNGRGLFGLYIAIASHSECYRPNALRNQKNIESRDYSCVKRYPSNAGHAEND